MLIMMMYRRESYYDPATSGSSTTFQVKSQYHQYPSHVVQHMEQIIKANLGTAAAASGNSTNSITDLTSEPAATPSLIPQPDSLPLAQPQPTSLHVAQPQPAKPPPTYWPPPVMPAFLPDNPSKSFLESSLQKNLSDLDDMSRSLRKRLCIEEEVVEEEEAAVTDPGLTYTVNSPQHGVAMTTLQDNIASNLEALRHLVLDPLHRREAGTSSRQE